MCTGNTATQAVHDTVGMVNKVKSIIDCLGIPLEIDNFIHSSRLSLQNSGPPLQRHGPRLKKQSLMNGQLYVDCTRISGMLGLPSCSKSTWQGVVDRGIGKVCDRASWVVLHTFKECHQDPQCSLIRWLLPYMGPLLEQVLCNPP